MGVEETSKSEPKMSIKNVKTGTETFAGKVVKVDRREERIMSDVWDWVTYAVVIMPDGTFYEFPISYEETAAADTTPEELAAYWEWWKAKNLAEAKAAADRAAEIEAATIRVGKTVEVVRGRKVAIGTVGKVFWIGDTTWGKKVGIALDDAKNASGRYTNVAFTAIGNVEVARNLVAA
jgi:hypothetical protein